MTTLRTHKKLAILTSVLAIVLVFTGWWLGHRTSALPGEGIAEASPTAGGTPHVTTWVVARSLADDVAEATGTVVAAQRAELAPKIMGRVAEVYVHEGQRVTKGQLLMQLEASDLASSVTQASANAGAASAALTQAQTAATLQREQSRSRVEQATANLRQAQARLSAVQEGSRTQEKAVAMQRIAMAEAEARNAEANYSRYQKLFDQGVVSAMDADRYRMAYDVAKSHLETAKQQASLTYEGNRQQEIDAARSQVAQAQDALRFAKASVAENRIKQDQIRLARAQLGQASAARSGASIQYSYSRIVAPFSGVVTARLVDPGDLASPERTLIVMEDDSLYRLEASIPEDALRYLQLDQTVPITLALSNQPLYGRVSRIIPSADPSSRTFIIKVDLPPARGVNSGIFGRLQIRQGSRNAIEVPSTAIVSRGQLSQIYTVEKGKARLQVVTIGKTQNSKTEVLSGLQPGEHIITNPPSSLEDGQSVQEALR